MLLVRSVVPQSQNNSTAVKALRANSNSGSLRQYQPYAGPYYGINGFNHIMAIDEVGCAHRPSMNFF